MLGAFAIGFLIYRQGIKDGQIVKEGRPLPKMVSKPVPKMTKEQEEMAERIKAINDFTVEF